MKPRGRKTASAVGGRCWLHVSPKQGHPFDAWVAGEPVGMDSHYISSTKPCLRAYLGSSAHCPGCAHPSRVEEQWLQPFYRCSDARPVCVWFHEDMLDVLCQLKLHEQVTVGRHEGSRIGCHVTRKLTQVAYQTTLPERRMTANIALYMPTLFGLEGVITPEMLVRGPLDESAGLTPEQQREEFEKRSDVMVPTLKESEASRAKRGHFPGRGGVKASGETLDDVFDSIRQKSSLPPSSNGTGKH